MLWWDNLLPNLFGLLDLKSAIMQVAHVLQHSPKFVRRPRNLVPEELALGFVGLQRGFEQFSG